MAAFVIAAYGFGSRIGARSEPFIRRDIFQKGHVLFVVLDLIFVHGGLAVQRVINVAVRWAERLLVSCFEHFVVIFLYLHLVKRPNK